LQLGERSLDDGEFLDVFTATQAQLSAWCRDGQVIDGKTLVGAWWWQQVAAGQWALDWQDT
jgi:ADP-ribose pyrophosphatase